MDIIKKIKDGFDGLAHCREETGIEQPTLALVAHFIKRSDKGDGNVRFASMRKDLEHQIVEREYR